MKESFNGFFQGGFLLSQKNIFFLHCSLLLPVSSVCTKKAQSAQFRFPDAQKCDDV